MLQDRATQGCDPSGSISLEHIKKLDGKHRLFSLLICSKTQSDKPTQKKYTFENGNVCEMVALTNEIKI